MNDVENNQIQALQEVKQVIHSVIHFDSLFKAKFGASGIKHFCSGAADSSAPGPTQEGHQDYSDQNQTKGEVSRHYIVSGILAGFAVCVVCAVILVLKRKSLNKHKPNALTTKPSRPPPEQLRSPLV